MKRSSIFTASLSFSHLTVECRGRRQRLFYFVCFGLFFFLLLRHSIFVLLQSLLFLIRAQFMKTKQSE